jgi:hypothetical protein
MSARRFTPWPTTLWYDGEFQQLTPQARYLYAFLWTQPNVNSGGFLDLHVTKWAKATGMAVEQIERALDDQLARGWVLMDDDTEDLWLCRWIREDAINSPKIWIGALRAIQVVPSRTLRHAAYKEVCGLDRPLSETLQRQLDEAWRELTAVVEREGGKPFRNPSGTLSIPAVVVAGEGVGEEPSTRARSLTCDRCGRHPAIERGLCGACLGREMS